MSVYKPRDELTSILCHSENRGMRSSWICDITKEHLIVSNKSSNHLPSCWRAYEKERFKIMRKPRGLSSPRASLIWKSAMMNGAVIRYGGARTLKQDADSAWQSSHFAHRRRENIVEEKVVSEEIILKKHNSATTLQRLKREKMTGASNLFDVPLEIIHSSSQSDMNDVEYIHKDTASMVVDRA